MELSFYLENEVIDVQEVKTISLSIVAVASKGGGGLDREGARRWVKRKVIWWSTTVKVFE